MFAIRFQPQLVIEEELVINKLEGQHAFSFCGVFQCIYIGFTTHYYVVTLDHRQHVLELLQTLPPFNTYPPGLVPLICAYVDAMKASAYPAPEFYNIKDIIPSPLQPGTVHLVTDGKLMRVDYKQASHPYTLVSYDKSTGYTLVRAYPIPHGFVESYSYSGYRSEADDESYSIITSFRSSRDGSQQFLSPFYTTDWCWSEYLQCLCLRHPTEGFVGVKTSADGQVSTFPIWSRPPPDDPILTSPSFAYDGKTNTLYYVVSNQIYCARSASIEAVDFRAKHRNRQPAPSSSPHDIYNLAIDEHHRYLYVFSHLKKSFRSSCLFRYRIP